MANIKETINEKKLEDIKPIENTQRGSNLIEPTAKMINSVVERLKNGESYKNIKRNVKKEKTNLSLSYGQIKEIELIWKNIVKVKEDTTGNLELSEDGLTIINNSTQNEEEGE